MTELPQQCARLYVWVSLDKLFTDASYAALHALHLFFYSYQENFSLTKFAIDVYVQNK